MANEATNNDWADRLTNFIVACACFVAFGVPLLMYLLDLQDLKWFWGGLAATYSVTGAVCWIVVARVRRRQSVS